jgi:hypothetical protein
MSTSVSLNLNIKFIQNKNIADIINGPDDEH